MRLPGASHWIGVGEVSTTDLAAIPKDFLPFQQLVRLGQSVVRHRRQKVVGEVVPVVARVDQPAPDTVASHVTRKGEHAARPKAEVIAHLAEGGDQMECRRSGQQPDLQEWA